MRPGRIPLAVRIGRGGVVATFLVAILGGNAVADDSAASFSDWVNTLYVGAAVMREAGAELSDQEIQSLFTPEVQALRDRTRDRALPPSEPEGPILHILFGWGALPNRKIEIVSVTPDGDSRAVVSLTINGNPQNLVLAGRFNEAGKAWQIDDIDYGEGGPDRTLRGRLERMLGWPKK